MNENIPPADPNASSGANGLNVTDQAVTGPGNVTQAVSQPVTESVFKPVAPLPVTDPRPDTGAGSQTGQPVTDQALVDRGPTHEEILVGLRSLPPEKLKAALAMLALAGAPETPESPATPETPEIVTEAQLRSNEVAALTGEQIDHRPGWCD